MSDRELLAELSRLESVEVIAVSDGDHTNETVEPWCELVMNLEDSRGVRQIQLTRHDAELVIEALFEVLHPQDNRSSARTRIWAKLDETMDYLMGTDEPESEDKATARALAFALACITKPYSPETDVEANINEIRAIAVERWEERD